MGIGQVHAGFTHGGIITGVDYGHGAVSGFGAIGNRGIYGVYGKREAEADPYYYGGYGHGYYPYSYGHFGVYGKRDADAEAEPYVYANGVVSTYGHPVVSTVAAAVPAVNTVAAVNTVVPTVHSAVNTVAHAAVPAVAAVNTVA